MKYVMPVVMVVVGVFTAGAGFAALGAWEGISAALTNVALGLGSMAQGARSLSSLGGGRGGGGLLSPLSNENGFIQLAQANLQESGVFSDASHQMEFMKYSRPRWMDDAGLEEPIFNPLDIFFGIAGIAKASIKVGAKKLSTTVDFFKGTKYSDKVIRQMKVDDFHNFPRSVEGFQSSGTVGKVTGRDGISRETLEIPGAWRDRDGVFEFIKETDGTITHRFFNPNNPRR